ncbi:MAG: ASPIC/UnbV domain-containing protein, partial [Myxococcota bacterium]|nr:ASPIC/UnbV domain-containing protein [Myxococcota bacterium]
DYDRDGDLDIYVNQSGNRNYLWRNTIGGENYLMVRVWARVGPDTYRDDIGATVRLFDDEGNPVSGLRQISGGESHGCQPPPLVHFGLPDGPDIPYQVSVQMQHGGAAITQSVVPSELGSYHLLEIYEPATGGP